MTFIYHIWLPYVIVQIYFDVICVS